MDHKALLKQVFYALRITAIVAVLVVLFTHASILSAQTVEATSNNTVSSYEGF